MQISNSVYRKLLVLEVLAAYAFPASLLLAGSLFVPISILLSLSDIRPEQLLILSLICGGFLGMIGVLHQANILLNEEYKPLGRRTFLYTFVGCLAVLPFTYIMLDSGKVLGILAGLAPILVAIQLTFMNRAQLVALYTHK